MKKEKREYRPYGGKSVYSTENSILLREEKIFNYLRKEWVIRSLWKLKDHWVFWEEENHCRFEGVLKQPQR